MIPLVALPQRPVIQSKHSPFEAGSRCAKCHEDGLVLTVLADFEKIPAPGVLSDADVMERSFI